jgi:hypothetical protein
MTNDYEDKKVLLKGQTDLGSARFKLPNGDFLEIDVYTENDDDVYITTTFRKKGGGIKGNETCFYCDGVKLGCITCPSGQSASGNCIDRSISCERPTVSPN